MNVHVVTRFAADGIVNSLIAGMVIALLAWIIAKSARRQGPGPRFAVWLAALVAVALLPWLGSVGAASHQTVPALATGLLTLPASFAYVLFGVWIVGAGLGLLHVAHGLYRLQRLRATCVPVHQDQLDAALRTILADNETHRRVTLCTSEAVRVPAAIGYFRPMVVFPSWALAELPPAELNAILLHELAHLRRWDDWTNLAQKIVKAVFFFHPAVWFIESRLTLEREMACDDAVLAASFSPRAYAESLVSLAEKSFLHRGVQLAQAAVSHVQQLKLRLAEILRKDRPSDAQRSTHKPAIALMSLAAIVTVYGFSHAPRLIGFSSDSPQTASADSHSLSSAKASRLQPVNLNYTDRSHPVSAPACKVTVQRAHRHLPVRVETTTPVLMANRPADTRMSVEMASSRMVLSSFPIEPDASRIPVLVVFQSEQFGANGPIFWRVTVLQLTPAQQRVISGGIPKQI